MSENDIKEELYSLLKQINEDIPNDKQLPNIQNIKNLSNCDSITLINYIKESLPILIEQKISEIILILIIITISPKNPYKIILI